MNHKLKQYKSVRSFRAAIDYFNKPCKIDTKSLSNCTIKDGYYIPSGSTGGWDSNGDKSVAQCIDEFNRDCPSNIWTNFVSIKKENAKQLGLIDKEQFALFIERIVMYMSKVIGINTNDLVWGAFYHIDKPSHPHVHFYFYDRAHPYQAKLLTKNQIMKIKSMAASDLIERSPSLARKDEAQNAVKDIVKEIVDVNNLNADALWLSPLSKDFTRLFQSLIMDLPTSGRLSYNAHTLNAYKPTIDQCIDIILHDKSNFSLYKKFLNELDNVVKLDVNIYGQMKDESQDAYKENQIKKLYSSIGNHILQQVKLYRESYISADKMLLNKNKKKEITYVNKRIQSNCGYNTYTYARSTMFQYLKHINLYQQKKNQEDLLRSAQEEINNKQKYEYDESYREEV